MTVPRPATSAISRNSRKQSPVAARPIRQRLPSCEPALTPIRFLHSKNRASSSLLRSFPDAERLSHTNTFASTRLARTSTLAEGNCSNLDSLCRRSVYFCGPRRFRYSCGIMGSKRGSGLIHQFRSPGRFGADTTGRMAPPRFSVTTGFLKSALSCSTKICPTISVVPPGGNGTTRVML